MTGDLPAAELTVSMLGAGHVARVQAGQALELPVVEVVARYAPYRDFCRRQPPQ